MNSNLRINQVRQELIELYKKRQELVESQSQFVSQNSEVTNDNTNIYNSNEAAKSAEPAKVLTLSNGHSILGDNKFNGGFTNILVMALLAGFASGAIATAIYIFSNLSKVAVSL